jgi:hypothetical protein
MTKPSGVVAGDFLVIVVGNRGTVGTSQFSDDVTGWAQLSEQQALTGGVYIDHSIYTRRADGTEGSTTTITSTSANKYNGHYLRISGTRGIDVSAHQSENGGTTHTCPSITTTEDDCLAIYYCFHKGTNGAPLSTPSGWVEQDEDGNGSLGTQVSFGTKTQASAGATGDANVVAAVSNSACYFQLAVEPTVDYTLTIDSGSYAITGSAVGLPVARKLAIDSGSYAITGSNITLTHTEGSPSSSGPPKRPGLSRRLGLRRGG